MASTFDLQLRVLSCEKCGAPVDAPPEGGSITCSYCSAVMIVGQRRIEAVRTAHSLEGPARIAKLRMESGRPLPNNPYSTLTPPPGCEGLTQAGLRPVLEQLAQRFREAIALVRADPAFDHQRLLWWCATQLNQGYGIHKEHRSRRGVLERAIEEISDPGFRHLLFVNLAGAAASLGELDAAWEWIAKCDPEPADIMLDSGYRIGLGGVLVRAGQDAEALEVVGARAGDVPEAHQYRMMFTVYRIHALETLGRLEDAMAAAREMQSDPSVGHLVGEALKVNELGLQTAAALQSPGWTRS